MTDKINELMRLATDLCAAQMKTSAEYVDAYETLRSALEAALKPGELNKDKARKVAQCAFAIFPHVKGKFPAEQALNELVGYTAPPAQTPPRDDFIHKRAQLDAEWSKLREMERQCKEFIEKQKTQPPRLTDGEVERLWKNGTATREGIRAIESAVRKQLLGRDE